MVEEQSGNGSSSRSWFEKLGQALSGEPKDRQQLLELLQEAEQRNVLGADALTMIEGVLQVADMQVRDIMVHARKWLWLSAIIASKKCYPLLRNLRIHVFRL